MTTKPNNRQSIEKLLSQLVLASLEGNKSKIESLSLTLARMLAETNPLVSQEIKKVVGNYSLGGSPLRGANIAPPPVDAESQLEIISIIPPDITVNPEPILSPQLKEKMERFLEEREKTGQLLDNNIKPSSSLLLIGSPGTGKTMLAKHIASMIGKNLVVLDLASSISSLLGKTGHNLKKALNYAKQTSSVLLLDEFDAIAKRRDDPSDLGELKRVVNVLLMELEDWPVSSVLIATSNHPELLDRGIWRRFDHVWELDLPQLDERLLLLKTHLLKTIGKPSLSKGLINLIIELMDGASAADIRKYGENVKRRMVLGSKNITQASLLELGVFAKSKDDRAMLCKTLRKELGDEITVRQIAEITGLSASGVQYHLERIGDA